MEGKSVNQLSRSEIKKLLEIARDRMEKDYKNDNFKKYPPLYSKDYLFGKIKAVKEILVFIDA